MFSTYIRELIILLLSIPSFKVCHFFFKCAFALQQLCWAESALDWGGEDFSLQFDNLLLNKCEITETYQPGLRNSAKKRLDSAIVSIKQRAPSPVKMGSICVGSPGGPRSRRE